MGADDAHRALFGDPAGRRPVVRYYRSSIFGNLPVVTWESGSRLELIRDGEAASNGMGC